MELRPYTVHLLSPLECIVDRCKPVPQVICYVTTAISLANLPDSHEFCCTFVQSLELFIVPERLTRETDESLLALCSIKDVLK